MSTVAITNCAILDICDGSLLRDAAIFIKGENIEHIGSVGPSSQGYALQVDVKGAVAIPGLIDLHVHLFDEADPNKASEYACDEPIDVAFRRAMQNCREAIAQGVTTVREVGAYGRRNLKLRDAVRGGLIPGPDIKACGDLITYPMGHAAARGIEVSDMPSIRQAVKENYERGADFLKVTSDPADVEAMGRTPDPTLSAEELTCLVKESHTLGMKVAIHTFPSIEGLNRALDAGVDTLEHAVPLDEQTLEKLLKTKAIIVPTFVAAYDEFSLKALGERTSVNSERAERFDSTNYPKERLHVLRGGRVPESIRIWFDHLIRGLPSAISLGVRIGIGTDAGCFGTNFRSAVREMFFLTQFGATNLQALQSATLVGAEALGEKGSLGKISPGYRADIVFCGGNPVEDLDALLDVQLVVSRGRIAHVAN
jgi:imidazolonepropionase-like amidohydrolase